MIQNIEIIRKTDNFYKLVNSHTKTEYEIMTPRFTLPFGLEEYKYHGKTNYFIKLDLDNDKFKNKIEEFERDLINKVSEQTGKTYYCKSQIIYSDDSQYKDKLLVKIKQNYGKIITKCLNRQTEITIFDLKKNDMVMVFMTPSIYIDNEDNFIIKWSAKKIFA